MTITLPNYSIKKLIHESSEKHVAVYEGINGANNQNVIIKTNNIEYPSLKDLAHLKHEYHILRNLDVLNTAHAYDLIHYNNRLFLILESIDGITLKDLLENKPINLTDFYKIAIQLADILNNIHQHKIIHKDINPANILINKKKLQVTLIDFSLSSELNCEVSSPKLEGTLNYISPEQTGRTNRIVDYRSDFYSLGITFYEMLTGKPPFQSGDPLELVYFHLTKIPESILNAPPLLEKLIFKLLAKNAEDRYSTALGLKADLQKLAQGDDYFQLGLEDKKNTFSISQKLYGRSNQIAQIISKFQEFEKTGASEVVFVAAPSGMGKTVLIQEVQKPLVGCKGIFIKGKYDILQKGDPFFGIVQAIKELINNLLAEENLDLIKKELNKAIGNRGRVIANLVPEISYLISELPPLEPLSAKENQNRLYITFENFFSVIAKKEHPLVIFLDDLQGIDSASMDLIKYLLKTTSFLFFIGAYRNDELPPEHPLLASIKEIPKQTTIHLSPLTKENIEELLRDTLLRSDIAELADQAYIKTKGNPFFVIEFLKTLNKEGMIFYESRWEFDLDKIVEAKMTTNVIELMLKNIKKLSSSCQNIISIAACIGSTFDLKTLNIITQTSIEKIAEILWEAVKEGFILTRGSEYQQAFLGENIAYHFQHDKVQEAAYHVIKEDKRLIHLQIARHLLNQHAPLFEILDHYNRCLDSITNLNEKNEVAELNRQASSKAKASNAYPAYLHYLEAVRLLIGHVNIEIEKDYGEGLFLNGRFKEAENHLDNLLSIKTLLNAQKMEIYAIYAEHYANVGEYRKAISHSIQGLYYGDIYIPKKLNKLTLLKKILYLQWIVYWLGKDKLKQTVKIRKEPIGRSIERLLPALLMSGTGLKDNLLLGYVSLTAIINGIQKGFDSASIEAIFNYTFFLMSKGKYKETEFWCNLGNDLADRLNSTFLQGRAAFLSQAVYGSLTIPVSKLIIQMNKTYEKNVDAGDFTVATYSLCLIASYTYFTNTLQEAKKEAQRAFNVGKASNNYFALLVEAILLLIQAFEEGLKDPTNINRILNASSDLGKDTIYSIYSSYMFIHQKFDQAIELALKGYQYYHELTVSAAHNAIIGYFYSLSAYEKYSTLTKKQKDLLIYFHKQMEMYSSLDLTYYLCLYLHMSAQLAALKGKYATAAAYFEQALNKAEEDNYHQFAAIISECASRFHSKLNQKRFANYYLKIAHHHYLLWGALEKVKEMEKGHPELTTSKESSTGDEITSSSTSDMSLDYLSLIKATQAISSEMILERLLEKLIRIVKENAGAHRVVVIMERGGELYIEAEGRPEEEIKLFKNRKILSAELPLSIVNYVMRSKKHVLLNDIVDNKGQFQNEAYLNRNQIKSLLCFPILYKSNVMGVLYLENHLVTHAFTDSRVQILNVLTSQAAISLENAGLFERLNRLLLSSERFVPKPFLELLHKQSIEDINLEDGEERELTVMFTDLRNFTTIMQKRTSKETFKIVNRYLKYVAPIIRNQRGFINQFMGDGIMALFPYQAENAIKAGIEILSALKEFNRQQKEQGEVELEMSIGINTGIAMLGMIGEEERLDPTVISDVTNTAARIESLNKSYGSHFLISDNTFKSLTFSKDFLLRKIDRVFLKGRDIPTDLIEVIDWADHLKGITINQYIAEYNKAFQTYSNGDFELAKKQFKSCLELLLDDQITKVMIERCERFIAEGTPKNWDGTFLLTFK